MVKKRRCIQVCTETVTGTEAIYLQAELLDKGWKSRRKATHLGNGWKGRRMETHLHAELLEKGWKKTVAWRLIYMQNCSKKAVAWRLIDTQSCLRRVKMAVTMQLKYMRNLKKV